MRRVGVTLTAGLFGCAIFAFAGSAPAAAGPVLPWCVESAGGGLVDCSFYTHRQCVVASRGVGPCVRNGAFDWKYYLRGEPAPLDVDPHARLPRRHYRG
jgi:hypothetical protein